MADRTAALMKNLDAPRPIPARMRDRLEGALISATLQPADENLLYILDRPKRLPADMRSRLTATLTGESDADIAERMALLDGPRPLPAAMRARLMTRLMTRSGSARWLRVTAAAAAAVLVMAGTFALTVSRGPDSSNRPDHVLGERFTQLPSEQPTDGIPVLPTFIPPVQPPASVPPRNGGAPGTTGGSQAQQPSAPRSLTPQAQPTGGLEQPGFTAGTASRRSSADQSGAPAASLGLLDPVVTLLRDVLAALNVNTADRPAATVDKPKPPAAPASGQKTSAKKSSKPKAAATKPKAKTPKPAEEPKPLIELPLLGTEAIEVPIVEITLSL